MDGMKSGKAKLTENNLAAESFDIRKIFDSDGDSDWEDDIDSEDLGEFQYLGQETNKIGATKLIRKRILLLRLLAREGVFAKGGRDCLAYVRQKSSNIVGLKALRLALFMGYE